jgi:hypothetical protein
MVRTAGHSHRGQRRRHGGRHRGGQPLLDRHLTRRTASWIRAPSAPHRPSSRAATTTCSCADGHVARRERRPHAGVRMAAPHRDGRPRAAIGLPVDAHQGQAEVARRAGGGDPEDAGSDGRTPASSTSCPGSSASRGRRQGQPRAHGRGVAAGRHRGDPRGVPGAPMGRGR